MAGDGIVSSDFGSSLNWAAPSPTRARRGRSRYAPPAELISSQAFSRSPVGFPAVTSPLLARSAALPEDVLPLHPVGGSDSALSSPRVRVGSILAGEDALRLSRADADALLCQARLNTQLAEMQTQDRAERRERQEERERRRREDEARGMAELARSVELEKAKVQSSQLEMTLNWMREAERHREERLRELDRERREREEEAVRHRELMNRKEQAKEQELTEERRRAQERERALQRERDAVAQAREERLREAFQERERALLEKAEDLENRRQEEVRKLRTDWEAEQEERADLLKNLRQSRKQLEEVTQARQSQETLRVQQETMARSELEMLRRDKRVLERQLQELKDEERLAVKQREAEAERLRGELEALRKQTQHERERLEHDLRLAEESTRRRLHEEEMRAFRLEQELEKEKALREASESDVGALRKSLQRDELSPKGPSQQVHDELLRERDKLLSQIRRVEQDAADRQKEERERAALELAAARDAERKARLDQRQAEHEAKEAERKHDEAVAGRRRAEEERNAEMLKVSHERERGDRLQSELSEVKMQYRQLDDEHRRAAEQVQALGLEVRQHRDELDRGRKHADQELRRVNAEVAAVKSELAQKVRTIAELQTREQVAKQREADLQRKLDERDSDLHKRNTELEELRNQLVAEQEKVANCSEDQSRLATERQREVNGLKSDLTALKEKLNAGESRAQLLQKQKQELEEALRAERDRATKEVSAAREELRRETTERELAQQAVKSTRDSLEADVRAREADVHELRKKVDEMRLELSQATRRVEDKEQQEKSLSEKYRGEQKKLRVAEEILLETAAEGKARAMIMQEERDCITHTWISHARQIQWALANVRERSARDNRNLEAQASETSGRLQADKKAAELERDEARSQKLRLEAEVEELNARIRSLQAKADDASHQGQREVERLREDLRAKDDEIQRGIRLRKEEQADREDVKARLDREIKSLQREKQELRDRLDSSASASEKSQLGRMERLEDERRALERKLDDAERRCSTLEKELDSQRKSGSAAAPAAPAAPAAGFPRDLVVAVKRGRVDSGLVHLGGVYRAAPGGLRSLLGHRFSSRELEDWPLSAQVWERQGASGASAWLYSTQKGVWRITDVGAKEMADGSGCGRDSDFRTEHKGQPPHLFRAWPDGLRVSVPPQTLEVSINDDKFACGGTYALGPDLENGWPVWEKAGSGSDPQRRWIFTAPRSCKRPGMWCFADSRANVRDGEALPNYHSREEHNGELPHELPASGWQHQGVTVTAADDASALRQRVAELEAQLKAAGGAAVAPRRIEVGAEVRVRDSDREAWKNGTVTEMRGEKPVVKVDGASRAFTWAQVELRPGQAPAPAAPAADRRPGVGDKVRVRDTEREQWRTGTVTEMRGDQPVVKVEGASRGFTWAHIEPIGAPSNSGAGGSLLARAASCLVKGSRVRVRDSTLESWKNGVVEDITDGKPVVKVDGAQRSYTWQFCEAVEGGGGDAAALEKQVAELQAELKKVSEELKRAQTGGDRNAGAGFKVGDRVRVRDTEKEQWREGEVTQATDPLRPMVKVDGQSRGFTWQYVEKAGGGGGQGELELRKQLSELQRELKEAKAGKESITVGSRVRMRDTEREQWREGTVTEMRDGRPVVKADGASRSFTWNTVEPLGGGGGDAAGLQKELAAVRKELEEAQAKLKESAGGGKKEVALGDAVRVRDSDREPWKDGVVTELRDGRPRVKLDGQTKAFTWAQLEPKSKDGGGGGADGAALQKAERELEKLREELSAQRKNSEEVQELLRSERDKLRARAEKAERELERLKDEPARRSSVVGSAAEEELRTLRREADSWKQTTKHNENMLTRLCQEKKELEKALGEAEEKIRVFERKREERKKRKEKKGQRDSSSDDDHKR